MAVVRQLAAVEAVSQRKNCFLRSARAAYRRHVNSDFHAIDKPLSEDYSATNTSLA
jgi:hypothetical protein